MSEPEAPDGRQPVTDAAPVEPASEGVAHAAEPADAAEVTEGGAADAGSGDEPPRHRHPFYLRGRRPRLPRSRAGLFALLLVLGAVGFVGVFASVSLISWTETADFCGRCHTMAPELQAYHAGPHRDVSCGECHVEPGITGWVKAKMNGTRQLIDVVLGTFPTPIEPPDHGDLPVTEDTCQKCHALDQRQFVGMRTKTGFSEDETNTRQFVGLMIRPGGGNTFDVDRSVHWHVLNDVEYSAGEVNAPGIDYVKATKPDGTQVEYISGNEVTDSEDVTPDIEKLTGEEPLVKMSCYDCHNRIGHSVGNPRNGIDYAMYSGQMDNTLPYIKREAMRILWNSYPDEETAAAEADKLVDFYKTNYPEVYATKLAQINEAINAIKVLYRKTATPEMKVTAKTYADNLGHTDFPGCFRCHDGGHYKIENGSAVKKVIPSTCDTCHTFPQIGPAVASVPLGEPPSTHVNDELWVFNHRSVATSVDPGGQTCGECHARDYCVNCHATGAVTVDHDEMATNHAQVIREQGNTACAYCHQPAYCARCHKDPVLPITTPFSEGVVGGSEVPAASPGASPGGSPLGSPPAGVAWPLVPPGHLGVLAPRG